MFTKKCLICGQDFIKPYKCWIKIWNKRKYCSRECYYQSRRKENSPRIYKRNCNCCGKYYEGRGKYFCSHSCSSKTVSLQKGHTPWNKNTHIQTNTGKTHFKKGNKINVGRKKGPTPEKIKEKLRKASKGKKYPNRKKPPPHSKKTKRK